MQARAAMQPMYCPGMKQGKCIDAKRPAFAYMAHYIVRAMYKAWPTTSSWVTMPYFQLQEKFSQGCRYDVLGNWPGKLCEVDPETKVSRDVTDEEILEFARAKADPEDPEGVYLLRRFRANQILSTMIGSGNKGDALQLPVHPERHHSEAHGLCDVFFDSSVTKRSDRVPVHRPRGHRSHAKYQGHVCGHNRAPH